MTESIYEAGSWIYKMFFTLVIGAIIIAMLGIFLELDINTAQVQSEVMRNRILFDPHSIWYVNEFGVYQPGLLNRDNFTQEHVDKMFSYSENYGGAKLTLIENGKTTAVYVNEISYTRINTNVGLGIDSQRGGTVTRHVYPVVIREPTGARTPAQLVIDIAGPATT